METNGDTPLLAESTQWVKDAVLSAITLPLSRCPPVPSYKKWCVPNCPPDDLEFTKRDLGQAFRRRWDAELNLRSLQIVLQMDYLRCKTPHRVHNEFYMHMLAYNLIRKTIVIAAAQHVVQPYQINFKGALQTLMNFLASLHVDTDLDQWCIRLLSAIASEEIGNRPDRVEPRVKKRRPKPYDAMTKPRSEYKKAYR